MVRLAIYSPDARLKSLLTSAVKQEYDILPEMDVRALTAALKGRSEIDVLLLDCGSHTCPIEQQLALYDQIGDTDVPIVVMTDDQRRATTMEFLRRGAFDCIGNPPSLIEFRVVIDRAYQHAMTKAELNRMRETIAHTRGCDQMVGSSGKALLVYDLIRRVANLSASVLITGESGTGKELVARAIHNTGNRSGEPFVAVSCGALPESLIESELFGHERGAFTGSAGPRAGYLEEVGAGTLFLDEIGELSLKMQVKLLRVLQQREFSRLGSNRLIPVRARILFATHRDLGELTKSGEFRTDLFYRVNVINVHVPPLRERTEDIPTLASHFLHRYSEEYQKPVMDIRPNAMEALVDYDWPGNIRELENVIQGAVIRTDGDSLCRSDLPEHLQCLETGPVEVIAATSFEELLRNYKIELVTRALEDCHGNKTLAAQKLGLSRAYVHRLLRLGSSPETFDLAETA